MYYVQLASFRHICVRRWPTLLCNLIIVFCLFKWYFCVVLFCTCSDHGRRRVLILAIIPRAPENISVFRHVYDGLRKLKLISLNSVLWTYHSDFKAIGIAIGHLHVQTVFCCCLFARVSILCCCKPLVKIRRFPHSYISCPKLTLCATFANNSIYLPVHR